MPTYVAWARPSRARNGVPPIPHLTFLTTPSPPPPNLTIPRASMHTDHRASRRTIRAYTIREAAKLIDISLKGASVAIQGFGNAGSHAARILGKEMGCQIVAVSDSKGGVYNKDGLDIDAVLAHKEGTSSVFTFPGGKSISNEALLELEVDVLCPSALENVITASNAKKVKARIVAELANGPTTPEADEILFKNGSYVIPDFLCNAGGVTVSYFEGVQNSMNYYWDLEEVRTKLDSKMTRAFRAVDAMAKEYKVNNRKGAYLVSVKRVADAMETRGWV